jgi:GxxExxY protein
MFKTFLRSQHPMHRLSKRAAALTKDVIGAAIEVHRDKGPGLLESIYEWCLMIELELRGHGARSQKEVVIQYRGRQRKEELRFDVLVDECLLVEVKAVEKVHPIHKAQLLSYMKLLDLPLGLLINFNNEKLTDGVSRLVLPGTDVPD